MALSISRANLEIAARGSNLADKRYINNATDVSSALSLIEADLVPPQKYGMEITKRF